MAPLEESLSQDGWPLRIKITVAEIFDVVPIVQGLKM